MKETKESILEWALGLEPTLERALGLEPTLERALGHILGSKTSHHKRRVFQEAHVRRTAGLREPRTAAGLTSEPQTAADMTSPRTAGLTSLRTVAGMTSEPRTVPGLTYPRTAGLNSLRMAAGMTSEPRTAAGLTSPRTAGLNEPRTAACLSERRLTGLTGGWWTDWMAGWFWIGAGHAPDTGGSLPSSSVLCCLGGPRGDGNWPQSKTGS